MLCPGGFEKEDNLAEVLVRLQELAYYFVAVPFNVAELDSHSLLTCSCQQLDSFVLVRSWMLSDLNFNDRRLFCIHMSYIGKGLGLCQSRSKIP